MGRSDIKVAVLYNLLERLERGEEKDIVAEEAVIEEIGAIEEGIRTNGYQFFVMAVRNEIEPVIHWLQDLQPDVVFNLCESVYGDSCKEMNIPSLLELLRIPYTGSPPLTLGLCQDKGKVKDILSSQGLLTPWYKVLDHEIEALNEQMFPMIVKPLHEDGSLGISRESVVYDHEALNRQIRYVIDKYQQPALVEEYIEGRELNVGMVEMNGAVVPLPISEIDYSEFPEGVPKICGYEAKWVEESIEYQKSKPICPAPLEGVVQKQVEDLAIKAFKLFGCRDYARVDMRIDRKGSIYILEVNPNPDISPPSGMARAIRVQGMSYSEFIGKVIESALLRRNGEMRR